jgi:hypothetical protein
MSIVEKTNYYDKYLKYKSKYNDIKSQIGGGVFDFIIFLTTESARTYYKLNLKIQPLKENESSKNGNIIEIKTLSLNDIKTNFGIEDTNQNTNNNNNWILYKNESYITRITQNNNHKCSSETSNMCIKVEKQFTDIELLDNYDNNVKKYMDQINKLYKNAFPYTVALVIKRNILPFPSNYILKIYENGTLYDSANNNNPLYWAFTRLIK